MKGFDMEERKKLFTADKPPEKGLGNASIDLYSLNGDTLERKLKLIQSDLKMLINCTNYNASDI